MQLLKWDAFLCAFTWGLGPRVTLKPRLKLQSVEQRTSVLPFEGVGAVNRVRGGEGRTRLLESEEDVTA